MTTAISCSEKSRFAYLIKHHFRSNAAYTIISALICIVAMPFIYITNEHSSLVWYISQGNMSALANYFTAGPTLNYGIDVGIQVMLMLLTAMAAIISNGYLYSKSMTDFYHSLPSSRGQLFTTRFMATCGSILAPFYAIYFLMMLFQVIYFGRYGVIGSEYIMASLNTVLVIFLSTIIAYLFCALICVNVGTPLDALAAIAAVGFMPLIVFASLRSMFDANIYGAYLLYEYDSMLAVSPISYPFYIMLCYFEDVGNYRLSLLGGVAICAIMYMLSVILYNKRKSELAEQAQSRGKLQTFVKCAAAYCGSLFFYYAFNVSILPEIFIYGMIGAIMAGIVAEIIMSRGVRMIKRNMVLVLVAGFATCLIFTAFMYDWFGYETYVPEPEKVQSVSIGYPSHYRPEYYYYWGDAGVVIKEPENIELIIDVHRQLTQHRKNEEYNWNDYVWSPTLVLEYKLKDGRTIRRRYNETYIQAMTNLAKLEVAPEYIRQNHLAFIVEDLDGSEYWDLGVNIYDSLMLKNQSLVLNEAMMSELLEALQTDILAQSYEDITNPSTQALGYLELYLAEKNGVATYEIEEYIMQKGYSRYNQSSTVVLSKSFVKTMALLEKWNETDLLEPDLSRVDEMRLVIDGGEYLGNRRVDIGVQVIGDRMKHNYYNDAFYNIDNETTIVAHEDDYYNTESTNEWYSVSAMRVPDSYTITIKPEDFETLDKLSQNQLFFSRQDVRLGKVCFLYMMQNGQVIGGKFIQPERLPESLLREYRIDEVLKVLEESWER